MANLYAPTTPNKGFAKSSKVICVALTLKTAPRSDAINV
jgi:hypothetical protein